MSLIHMAELLDGVGQMAKAMHEQGILIDNNISLRAEGYWRGAVEMFKAMAKAQGVSDQGVFEMTQRVEARHDLRW